MQFDQPKRREFITLLGGAAVAWPLAAQQAERTRRIAVLANLPADDLEGRRATLRFLRYRLPQMLREHPERSLDTFSEP